MTTLTQEAPALPPRMAAPVPTQDLAVRTGRVARAFIYLVLLLFALFYLPLPDVSNNQQRLHRPPRPRLSRLRLFRT